VDLEIRVPTCDVRELRASECQGFSLKWNRGGGGYRRRSVGGRDVHHTFSMPHGHAVPGQGPEELSLWVWRSAIAGMGVWLFLLRCAVCPEPRGGTSGPL